MPTDDQKPIMRAMPTESMSRTAHRVRIGASPAEIWPALTEIERWPSWAAQFRRLERLDASPLAPGSRVRVTPRGLPASVWTVTELETERSFTWAASLVPGLRVERGHTIGPADGGSDAEFWLEAHGPLSVLLSPVLRRTVFRRNTRQAAEGLKRHVENERASAR